jgi:hypothetical protein
MRWTYYSIYQGESKGKEGEGNPGKRRRAEKGGIYHINIKSG